MSNTLLTRLRGIDSIRGPARAVLMVLADHADNKNVAWPSKNTIAREAGLGISTVKKHLSSLSKNGWIVITAQFHKDGGSTSNSYLIDLDAGITRSIPGPYNTPPGPPRIPRGEHAVAQGETPNAPKAPLKHPSEANKEKQVTDSASNAIDKSIPFDSANECAPSREEIQSWTQEIVAAEIARNPYGNFSVFLSEDFESWSIDWNVKAEQSGWQIDGAPMRNPKSALHGYLRKVTARNSKRFRELGPADTTEPPF